jgi:hypothetical protein
MKFNAKTDLDRHELYDRARSEAKSIYLKDSTRRGRSLEQIIETVLYGHAAELYLIKYHGFQDDLREYKDVIDTNKNQVEVKVTEGEYYVPYVLARCNEASKNTWRKYPKVLYVFIGDKETCDYHLYGVYHYNGKEFCLQTQEDNV